MDYAGSVVSGPNDFYLLLVRPKCVPQRVALHTLVAKEVATINTVISLFFLLLFYFSQTSDFGCVNSPMIVELKYVKNNWTS
jgi:hypothetical protein